MANSMNKILFLRRPGAFGGIEVLLLDWLRRINYEENEVVLGSTKDYFSDAINKDGLPVVCKTLSLPVLGNFISLYKSWATEIKNISPDKIIIMQGTIDEIPLPCVLAAHQATHGNVYMTEHLAAPLPPKKTSTLHYGFLPGAGIWWYKMMLMLRMRGHLAKRVLAVSEGVKNVLLMYGYPPGKITIAYHGVDASRFSPSDEKRKNWRLRYAIPEKDVVIVSTARLAKEKRIESIIRAFGRLSRENGALWLMIAGDGPLRNELENERNFLGCRDRIKLLGLVENVSELLQGSDIFVLPSDREGLSVSLTEAMAAGLVCIASDVSGSNEVIRDGENGFLIEPSDQGVLQGMEKVLKMSDAARNLVAQNARRSILEHFEMKKSVTNILGLLDIKSI